MRARAPALKHAVARFRDRALEDPETLKRLSALAVEFLEGQPDWGEAPTREISALELNHLRALGYAIP